MKNGYKIITCCGDESREDFLQEFLNYVDEDIVDSIYERGEQKSVVFVNSNAQFEPMDNIVIIHTDLIPLGFMLEFPDNYFNPNSIIFNEPCNKLLMFNQFPYRKRNLVIELARMLKEVKTIDSEVVLVRTKRRFAATDIISFEDTLNIALTDYAKIADRVSQYTTGDDKTDLFWIKATLQRNMQHQYLNALDECMARFNSEFNVKYSAGIGLRLKAKETLLPAETDVENYVLEEAKSLYLYFLNDVVLWDNGVESFLEDFKAYFGGELKNDEVKEYLREQINERLLVILRSIDIAA
jgi:hypothetical protein